ncbi:hypothetical protein ABFG93_22475 (plasmid) [Pseudalkalibacillus hwajinpoensis]
MKTWQKAIAVMMVIALVIVGWSTPILEANAKANAQSNEFDVLAKQHKR